jgi:prevent-host-death family protein
MKTINASEFKAKCLRILDEVSETHEIVTITKRGRPVAQLIPPVCDEGVHPQHTLTGSVSIEGDIVSPVLPADAWEAEGQRS